MKASHCYESGENYIKTGEYYLAYNQFLYAMDYVDNYQDSKSLSVSCVQMLMDKKTTQKLLNA